MSDSGIEFEEDGLMAGRRLGVRGAASAGKSKMIMWLTARGLNEKNAQWVLIGVSLLFFFISFLLLFFHFVL